jgi:factor associated with neutral sphingomyelinase activation
MLFSFLFEPEIRKSANCIRMAGRRAPKGGRFNLLLLSEDDHYLEDHGAHLVACETLAIALGHSAPAADAPPPRLKGRLRISARALFFEPDDELVPVVQFPYEHAASAEPVECGATSFCLVLIRYAFLYPDAPFVFHRASAAPVFELLHSALADVLPLLRRLVEIAHGPRPEEALEPIVAARVERFAFDSSWLDDVIAERVVAELRVQRLCARYRARVRATRGQDLLKSAALSQAAQATRP